jgi:hypothetical protein
MCRIGGRLRAELHILSSLRTPTWTLASGAAKLLETQDLRHRFVVSTGPQTSVAWTIRLRNVLFDVWKLSSAGRSVRCVGSVPIVVAGMFGDRPAVGSRQAT